MSSWNLLESAGADWGVTNHELYSYGRAEINISTRLLETNKQFPQVDFKRAINLTLDNETTKLVTLRQKYQESVLREKVLIDAIKEETNFLKKHESAESNITNVFYEFRIMVSRCQEIPIEQINELSEVEGKYIEKMRTIGSIFDKSQIERCAKLKEQLHAVTHELSVYREVLHQFLKDLIPEEKRKSNTCSICFDKEVNRCLNPCGHSFCDGCSSRLSSTECPTCRSKVLTVIPLFL